MKRLLVVSSLLLLTACGNGNEVDYTWAYECINSPVAQDNPSVCESKQLYEKAVQDYNTRLEQEKEKQEQEKARQEKEYAEQIQREKQEQEKIEKINTIQQELEKGNYTKAIKMIVTSFRTYNELVEVLGETENRSSSTSSKHATWQWWENFSQMNAVCYSVQISESDYANKRRGQITVTAEIHRFNVENGKQVVAEYSRVGHDWNIVE